MLGYFRNVGIHESKGLKYKSSLADFREELAVSLCKVGELVSPKRGRPTGDKQGNISDKKKQRNTHTTPQMLDMMVFNMSLIGLKKDKSANTQTAKV